MSESNSRSAPELLDCTIRDGNYAVEFRFDRLDTMNLVSDLDRCGFKWVEIGHGLGLGASKAGLSPTPLSDIEAVTVAKEAAGDARIGAFFIPGIGTREQLAEARQVGLDFVRIGCDVGEIQRALRYAEYANSLGYCTFVNVMKSYAVGPANFAEIARAAKNVGVYGVYCVDSAGHMLPEEVASYFDAAGHLRSKELVLGFHGHNNLDLVIANTVAAWRAGADILDVSLGGVGRSAGNASTEALIAVLGRTGTQTGHDLFDVLDVVDERIWPLIRGRRRNSPLATTYGFTGFHSSFFPQVAEAAARHGAEPRRLVAAVASHSRASLDTSGLEESALRLGGSGIRGQSRDLTEIWEPRLAAHHLQAPGEGPEVLASAFSSVTAKRPNLTAVVQFAPTATEQADVCQSRFTFLDSNTAIGKVAFGSQCELLRAAEHLEPVADFFVVPATSDGWAGGFLADFLEKSKRPAFRLDEQDLVSKYMQACVRRAITARRPTSVAAVKVPELLERCLADSKVPVVWVGCGHSVARPGDIRLGQPSDWHDLNLKFDLVILGNDLRPEDATMLSRVVSAEGRVLSFAKEESIGLHARLGGRLRRIDVGRSLAGLGDWCRSVEQGWR